MHFCIRHYNNNDQFNDLHGAIVKQKHITEILKTLKRFVLKSFT